MREDNNLIYRRINEEDLLINKLEIIQLLRTNYAENFPNNINFDEYVNKSFCDMKSFIGDGTAYVVGAFYNNKIVGFLWAYKRNLFGVDRLHINHIVVCSNFRSKGIGTKMIEAVQKYAHEKEIKIIELITSSENENAVNFYKKLDFAVTRVHFEKNIGDVNDN